MDSIKNRISGSKYWFLVGTTYIKSASTFRPHQSYYFVLTNFTIKYSVPHLVLQKTMFKGAKNY